MLHGEVGGRASWFPLQVYSMREGMGHLEQVKGSCTIAWGGGGGGRGRERWWRYIVEGGMYSVYIYIYGRDEELTEV